MLRYIGTLPVQMQQLPLEHIFPAALEQYVNDKLVRINAAKSGLDNDPTVVKKLEEAKKEIIATVYLQKEIEKHLTQEALRKAYDEYVAQLENVDEVHAQHILVKEEAEANALIQKLEEGADFAVLAKENSIDAGSAQRGGDIGFFAKADVVPEFADAAFAQEVGKHSFKPVRSDYGYHIIKVLEKRVRPTPTFEEIKPTLEARLRQESLKDVFAGWRKGADIEMFDINGKPRDQANADKK